MYRQVELVEFKFYTWTNTSETFWRYNFFYVGSYCFFYINFYFSQSWSVNSEVPKVFSLRSHANIYIIKSRDIIITLKPVYTSIKLLYSDIVDCKQYCSTIIPTSNIINISIKIHQEEIEIEQFLIYFLKAQNISY